MIKVPEAMRHFDRVVEWDPAHPETELRIDIPTQTIYINAAARPLANVVRVRFSTWAPRRWRWQ